MNSSFIQACLLAKNTFNFLLVPLFLSVVSGCSSNVPSFFSGYYGEEYDEKLQIYTGHEVPTDTLAPEDIGYPGSGYNPYHNATRARDYTLDLADQLEGLAPGDPLIDQARSAAAALDTAIRAMPYSDPTGAFVDRLNQALAEAGRVSGLVANRIEALTGARGGIPPDVPNDPSFRQTFTDVHGSP
jgi:hypothetical protein